MRRWSRKNADLLRGSGFTNGEIAAIGQHVSMRNESDDTRYSKAVATGKIFLGRLFDVMAKGSGNVRDLLRDPAVRSVAERMGVDPLTPKGLTSFLNRKVFSSNKPVTTKDLGKVSPLTLLRRVSDLKVFQLVTSSEVDRMIGKSGKISAAFAKHGGSAADTPPSQDPVDGDGDDGRETPPAEESDDDDESDDDEESDDEDEDEDEEEDSDGDTPGTADGKSEEASDEEEEDEDSDEDSDEEEDEDEDSDEETKQPKPTSPDTAKPPNPNAEPDSATTKPPNPDSLERPESVPPPIPEYETKYGLYKWNEDFRKKNKGREPNPEENRYMLEYLKNPKISKSPDPTATETPNPDSPELPIPGTIETQEEDLKNAYIPIDEESRRLADDFLKPIENDFEIVHRRPPTEGEIEEIIEKNKNKMNGTDSRISKNEGTKV